MLKTEVFAYFARGLCAWQCIWTLRKSIVFLENKKLDFEVGRLQIHSTSSKHRYKFEVGGQRAPKQSFLEITNLILEVQTSVLEAKKAILETKKLKSTWREIVSRKVRFSTSPGRRPAPTPSPERSESENKTTSQKACRS